MDEKINDRKKTGVRIRSFLNPISASIKSEGWIDHPKISQIVAIKKK